MMKEEKRNTRALFLIVFSLFMIITCFFLGFCLSFNPQSRFRDYPAYQFVRTVIAPENAFPGMDSLTILCLGLDVNWTTDHLMYTKNARSDTLILANLNIKEKNIYLISIPRDTKVFIPQYGHDKINNSYAIGGVEMTKEVIQDLLNINIDYHVVLKQDSLKNIVDAVGGIDIFVEKDMDYDDNWGYLHIHLKQGYQHLDGQKTMEYSRFRADKEGDYGRIRRQQQVIKAILKKAIEPKNLMKIPSIVETVKENILTNLTPMEILNLANIFRGISSDNLKMAVLPTVPEDILEGGYWVSYVTVKEDEAKKLIDEFIYGKKESLALRVEVLNGSGVPGKANKVAKLLENAGYIIAKVGNADSFDYYSTLIIDYTGDNNGDGMTQLLKTGQTFSIHREDREIDIKVIVGKDL